MILTNLDNETIAVEICMIKEFHRRGSVTVLTTKMNDKILIKETPAEIMAIIDKERGKR